MATYYFYRDDPPTAPDGVALKLDFDIVTGRKSLESVLGTPPVWNSICLQLRLPSLRLIVGLHAESARISHDTLS